MGWYRGSPEMIWIWTFLLAATAASWDLQQGGVLLAMIQLHVLFLSSSANNLCVGWESCQYRDSVSGASFSLTRRSLGQLYSTGIVSPVHCFPTSLAWSAIHLHCARDVTELEDTLCYLKNHIHPRQVVWQRAVHDCTLQHVCCAQLHWRVLICVLALCSPAREQLYRGECNLRLFMKDVFSCV